ncbi:synaptic vesicle glycoprotein 2B-like isoform X2 [Leptopilina heterotoma]|uniref:synaptic vesicle glycoprotein 2B-like isoform X2 n=1 Tax=Leptopilina heterotoma TaxID=63436 RepID=UPI001CAA2236|nr:synaptic vesicle glycoprotein 2B-like isoform X2 [Leptopilina heterotoma]
MTVTIESFDPCLLISLSLACLGNVPVCLGFMNRLVLAFAKCQSIKTLVFLNHSNGENGRNDESHDYEQAISESGYGFYNILLLLAFLPAGWSAVFDTTSSAFILPAVECVFDLTLFRKGVLVSIVYMGIIVSGILWDFMLQDSLINHLGKRNLLLLGLLVDSICNVTSAFVDSYYMFLLLKFISGVIVGGPFTILLPYLAEFHAPKYQPQFTRWAGFIFGISLMIPAALAFNVLPYSSPFSFEISGQVFATWQVYLLICSVPSVIGLITMAFTPDSPKLFMSDGSYQKALKSLRKIYSMNTWKSPKSYPVKVLRVKETQTQQEDADLTVKNQIRKSWSNAKTLTSMQYLSPLSILIFLQFGSMLGLNTMRLWVPQLFIMLNNFGRKFRHAYPSNETLTMCEMLVPTKFPMSHLIQNYSTHSQSCAPSHIEAAVYINSTIIAMSTVVFAFLAGFIMTSRRRIEIIMLFTFIVSIVCSFGVNWAELVPCMLTLSAAIVVTMRIAGNIVLAVNAQVIPVPLRSTAVSIINLIGNFAAVIGNFAFSSLLDAECVAAFMSIGCLMLACAAIVFVLPKPSKPPEIVSSADEERY